MSHGRLCPLCRKFANLTDRGRLWRHLGDERYLASVQYRECLASGFSPELAEAMRKNRDAGRHSYRCEDGSWIGPV